MKRLPWLRKILYFVCLGAGALILILQAANGYRAQTARGLPITSPQLLFGALVFTGLATGAQMLAWRTLMQGLGVSLGKREVLRGYMLSFLPRYIPGSVWGYLGRNEWLFQEYAVSYAASNLGSILEILASVTGVFVVVGLNWASARLSVRWPVLLIALPLLPAAIWVIMRRGFEWPLVKRLLSRFMTSGLFSGVSLQRWLAGVGLFVVHWLLNGVALGMTVGALSQQLVIPLDITLRFASAYSLAWFIGFIIIFAPAGLGFRELALSAILAADFATPPGNASAVAVLFRLVIIFTEVSWVAIALLLRGLKDAQTRK